MQCVIRLDYCSHSHTGHGTEKLQGRTRRVVLRGRQREAKIASQFHAGFSCMESFILHTRSTVAGCPRSTLASPFSRHASQRSKSGARARQRAESRAAHGTCNIPAIEKCSNIIDATRTRVREVAVANSHPTNGPRRETMERIEREEKRRRERRKEKWAADRRVVSRHDADAPAYVRRSVLARALTSEDSSNAVAQSQLISGCTLVGKAHADISLWRQQQLPVASA